MKFQLGEFAIKIKHEAKYIYRNMSKDICKYKTLWNKNSCNMG